MAGRRKSDSNLRQRNQPSEDSDQSSGLPYTTFQVTSKAKFKDNTWVPNDRAAFKLLLTVRLAAAVWSFISDCDETYNYWEPLHFLIYGKGFQTWEYSPEFALRSYLYILIHAVPGWLYNTFLSPNPMFIFYTMRCFMAVACSMAELYFFKGVVKEIGPNVGRMTLAMMAFSAGFFISSTAFLPSTTSMYLTMVSHGAWFRKSYPLAIFATALSALLSWPFAALLGLPIAIDLVLRKRRLMLFAKWSVISAFVILLPQVSIDSDFYGKFVCAPLNIITYNVFTSHGPDLYGTEPWHFYLFNGLLNFNFAFLAATAVIPLHYAVARCISIPPNSRYPVPHWLCHLGLYLWLTVFGLQPHKEERFLFPAYPLICLGAASTIDSVQKLFYCFFVKIKSKHYLKHTQWISVSALVIYSALCLSRIVGIYQNYSAPIDVWMHINGIPKVQPDRFEAGSKVNVCLGKEWYRFPNSFFLPNQDWEMKFLRSDFRGQLPQPYIETGSGGSMKESTRAVRDTFNDLNREEQNRYVTPDLCDFIVDLEVLDTTKREPKYSLNASQWQEEYSVSFLDHSRSKNKLLRAFYMPFLSWSHCSFGNYVLLKNKSKKIKH